MYSNFVRIASSFPFQKASAVIGHSARMDVVHYFFTKQLPRYFLNLPLPRTFGGFAELSGKEWLDLMPLIGFIFLFLMMLVGQFFEGKPSNKGDGAPAAKETIVNPSIDKEKEKIAQSFDIEDLGKKTVFCRCWRSKKVSFTVSETE